MSSLTQVSGCPGIIQVSVSTFIDDQKVVDKIIKLARNGDDPPIVFGWDNRGLEEFWGKAAGYAATVGPAAPPMQINGGSILRGLSTGQTFETSRFGFWNIFELK